MLRERAGGATVAARQEACANREGACERRHCDHKTHCYTLDLLPDEGHWIGRPQQVGAAFSDKEENRRVHGQAYRMDVDINDKKPAKPHSGKSHMIIKICNFKLYFAKSQLPEQKRHSWCCSKKRMWK